MCNRIFYSAGLAILLLAVEVTSQERLALDDAIGLGLENNYSIKIARNTAEIAANNTGKGTAGFLPVLNLLGGFNLTRTETETNSPFSFGNSNAENINASVSLDWTLFDGFRMFVDKSRYEELAVLGDLQAKSAIENTVVGIMRAYFNLVQQRQLLAVARETMAVSESRLERERVRREVGGSSSTDFLNAQVAYNNDRNSVLNAELQTEIAAKELNLLMGRGPDTPLEVVDEIDIPEVTASRETITTRAIERNSVYRIAVQQYNIADDGVGLASSVFYPRLSLGASYGYNDRIASSSRPDFPSDINTETREASVGLTLSFNIFNGFRDRIDLQNAKIQRMNEELAVLDEENRVRGLVSERYDTYLKRKETAKLEAENLSAAEQNLRLMQERYDLGTATSLEFRDAQINAARARTTLIAARYQARIAHLQLQQLMGEIEVGTIVGE